MAETYLQLLNTAAQVSANVYQQIDQSMTQRMNIQAQAGKFEVDTMAKAAQFAETQRVNDEQIINMRTNNYLQAQRLETEKMLIPVKMQTANLQLEAQRLNLQRLKETEGRNHFNSLTSIYDEQIGYALLETESSPMAQEYLGFKAQVSDYVSKGGRFDSSKFEEGLKTIRSKYADAPKPTGPEAIEYSPEKSYLLHQVSPRLGAEYDKRHPAVKGSRNSMAITYYDAEDAKQLADLEQFRGLYTESEWGQIKVGHSTKQRNNYNIKKYTDESLKIQNQIAIDKARELDTTGLEATLKSYQDVVNKAIVENDTLTMDATSGKFGVRAPVEPTTNEKPAAQKTDLSKVVPGSVMNVDPAKSSFDTTQTQSNEGVKQTYLAVAGTQKSADGKTLVAARPIEETELSEVDMGFISNETQGEDPGYTSAGITREQVEKGIENKVKIEDIEQFVTREKVDALFKTLDKNVSISVSPWLNETLSKNKSHIVGDAKTSGYTSAPTFGESEGIVTFGPKREGIGKIFGLTAIQSSDQLFEEINKIKNPAEKREAIKELYAALTAGSLHRGVTNKDK